MTTAVGVIGCGYWAQRHLRAWTRLAGAGASLAAVCDRDAARAREAATRFGAARWFTDAGEMLAAVPLGLVDIVTRMDTHRAMAEQAFAAGIPAIVQKPLAPDIGEARAIAAAAATHGTWCAVHENFRFQPAMVKAAGLMVQGVIGVPTWARLSYRLDPRVYEDQPYFRTEQRLIILDLGIHLLDLARVLLGEVDRVSCETQRRGLGNCAEDTATMLLRHRSGAVSTIDCTYEELGAEPNGSALAVVVEGTGGILSAPAGGRSVLVRDGRARLHEHEVAASGDDVLQASVDHTCAHLLAARQAGRRAETDIADNLETFALVEAAYEAASSGRSVMPVRGNGP